MLYFESPQWLHILWATPFLVGATWSHSSVHSKGRRIAIAVVRCLIISALAAALASPTKLTRISLREHPTVVWVQDVSESVGPIDPDRIQRRDAFIESLPQKVHFESIYFATNPASDNPQSDPDTIGTNIESALDFASDRVGSASMAHLILFSDGLSTIGDPISAATRVAGIGSRVHVIPIGTHSPSAPRIVSVVPPEGARAQLPTHVRVRVRTDQQITARVAILDQDGIEIAHANLRSEGDREVAIPILPKRSGPHQWRAILTASDSPSVGDEAEFRFNVLGPPGLLLSDPYPSDLEPLKHILEALGYSCHFVPVTDFPQRPESLAQFNAVLLSDWQAPLLDPVQLRTLINYLRNGGAALFIGGAQLNAERWHQSEMEKLLPIDFAPEPARVVQEYKPFHVCYVLDISGSMGEALGVDASGRAVSKIEMLRQAVLESAAQLPDSAIVSIITFDVSAEIVLQAEPATKRTRIANAVDRLFVGGGTKIVPALRSAADILNRTDIARHMIVLTDGVSESNPTDQLCDWIRNSDIHVTAVAVGSDSNTSVLQYVANRVNGQYVFCGDASAIPRVFVRAVESIRTIAELGRTPFRPRPGPQPELIGRLANSQWPMLEAALSADPKQSPLVEVALVTERGNPLLSVWPVGLGRVGAFMSDAKPVWSRHWFQWSEYRQFWAQLLTGLIRPQPQYRTRMRSEIRGNQFQVIVSMKDSTGRLVPDLKPQGLLRAIVGPRRGDLVHLEWEKLPAGLLMAKGQVRSDTRYVCELEFRKSDNTLVLVRQIVIGGPQSAELARTGPDETQLKAIAAAGNGLYNPTPMQLAREIEAADIQTRTVHRELWPWIVMVALLLWPIDVAIRKFTP